MTRILVADQIAQSGLDLLVRTDGVAYDLRVGLGANELASIVGQYEGLLIRSSVKITSEVLSKPGRLAAIARAGVGVDNVDVEAATQAGVLVLNTPDANTISTAEHTIALMLALSHQIPDAHQHVRAGNWQRSSFSCSQLAGKTLGIIGLGRVGRAVALRALGLDMHVLAHDPFIGAEVALEGRVRVVRQLDELLRASDYVSLHATLSDSTRHMIGASELALMKPTARLINCARGALVDEIALARALSDGRLAGAGLDVFEQEPPVGSPLLAAPNVLLTPHLAASTSEAQERVSVEAVEALLAYLLRGEISSAVNVTGIPANLSRRVRAFFDLVQRLGVVMSSWCADGLERIRLTTYGDSLRDVTPALSWQAMSSIVGPHLNVRLNLVNAPSHAAARGLTVEHAADSAREYWPEMVRIAVRVSAAEHVIEGTVFEDDRPRILSIDGYSMEIVPEGYMALIFNDDRPGVIGLVGQQFGDAGINIADMALSRRGSRALMVLKLDEPLREEMRDALRAHDPPIRSVHTLSLPMVRS